MSPVNASRSESNLISLLEISHHQQSEKHLQETTQLRATISDLLNQLDAQIDVTKNHDILELLVSRLRQANEHLVVASVGAQYSREHAESAMQRQEQFLAMLAHELRNPLAPIAMVTELIGKLTAGDTNLPRLHGILSRQVHHLSHLVDDLLDASRMSNGHMSLHKERHPLRSIIENAVEMSMPLIEQRHQSLRTHLTDMALYVDGDFLRLSQVFSNLLLNASKFSPEYETIGIHLNGRRNNAVVSVRDHGIGIAEEMLPQIFDLFTQGYHSLERAQGGLGIGLALVKTIVEMHGGTVEVHSDGIGLGSEFRVVLPLSLNLQIPSLPENLCLLTPRENSSANKLHILLIEDNLDTIAVMREVLLDEGHSVESASVSEHALLMLQATTGKPCYDIVICDLGLPLIDGFEIARRIKGMHLLPQPMLIAYTGYNQQSNRDEARLAGFDHFLVKPVAASHLLELLSLRKVGVFHPPNGQGLVS
jgi:signal transduction histidine kinase/ActR/RegA family two-component response regulator